MPLHHPVPSLYNFCVKTVYKHYNAYCDRNMQDRGQETDMANQQYMSAMLPENVIDDIRNQRTVALNNCEEKYDDLKCYYFNKGLMSDNVYKFDAIAHQYPLDIWKSLFMSFHNLRILNLYFSCTDEVLQLISENCPNLEFLVATSDFQVDLQPDEGNESTVALKVSDAGLQNLHTCTKLKSLYINDGLRYYSGDNKPSITFDGLRKLLKSCKSLEYLYCSDIGTVLANSMTMVKNLNLKNVAHYDATDTEIREIIRLCPKMENFQLCLSNYLERRQNAVTELVKCAEERKMPNLNSIILEDVTFNETQFETFYKNLGRNLLNITVINNLENTSFKELYTIAMHCPLLKELSVMQYSSSKHDNHSEVPPNCGQFQFLETLCICQRKV